MSCDTRGHRAKYEWQAWRAGNLNGLDPGESFRSVGVLHGTDYLQTVTTACHHCADPACLTGCPVDAYEKDPVTGIVHHLDDQCIGCAYCTLTCPYEVPRINNRLGIVRKCDMCAGRLAAGEAPACVQACPNQAIRITLTSPNLRANPGRFDPDSHAGSERGLVPGAPPSRLTLPTTRYVTNRVIPEDVVAADAHTVAPAHGHLPLAWMLVLTQLAVGAFVLGAPAPLAATAGVVALAGSVLHLGRPLMAWRAVIGLRHSWLSREIVAFGLFAPLAVAAAVSGAGALRTAGVVAGVAGVLCSSEVYAVTGRPVWARRFVLPRFVLSTALCGAVAVGAPPSTIALLAVAKLATELSVLSIERTAWLLLNPLRNELWWRLGLLAVGVVVAALSHWVALPVVVAGELIERHLFFSAEASPRMPGGIR